MPDTIVVTGSRYGSNTLNAIGIDFDFFSGAFGAFYIAFGSTTLGVAAGSGRRDFDIPAQDGRPHTTMHGLNATEAAQVLQALDNAHRDPSLTATFNEMEDHNVTLDVRIVTAPPSWFEDPSQIGGTRMSVIVNANGSNGPIQSGTTVEIVIVGGRLDAAGGQDDFRHVLAHELTHLFRDSSGNFLDEFHVQQRDGQTFSHLFSVDSSSNILESIDVTPQYSSADYYWHHIGTDGNNFFRIR